MQADLEYSDLYNKGVVTSDVVLKCNSLSAKVLVTNRYAEYNVASQLSQRPSPKFLINNSAHFQLQVISFKFNNSKLLFGESPKPDHHMIYVRFAKHWADDELTYKFKLTIEEFEIKDKCFTSDNGTWQLIHRINKPEFSFNLHVIMETVPSIKSCETSFAELHDDTELTDFELRGEDGSVHVHRVVLALASPVFRRMLSGGAWRETSTGHVDIPGISKSTLEHFKTYMYLKKLPEHGLEQLLLLSSCYIMPDLENNCIDKLVQNLRAEDVYEMIDFATKNKATNLFVAVLECVQKGAIKVADIRAHITDVGASNTEDTENSALSYSNSLTHSVPCPPVGGQNVFTDTLSPTFNIYQ